MTQRDVTKSGQHLAKALVTPSGGGADATLADVAEAAGALASTEKPGRVALATAEQTAAGTDAARAVTPAALAAQDFITRSEVTFEALNDNGDVGRGVDQVAAGDHGHGAATATAAGFMSSADKAKLDAIAAAAQVDAVTTVFGRTGAIAAEAGDYAASQVANDAAAPGTTLAEALGQLHMGKADASDLAAHAAATDNPHAVTKAQLGLANVPDLKVRLDATTGPAAVDDLSSGYAVGSRWVNLRTGIEFVCVDATPGAAVWKSTTDRGFDVWVGNQAEYDALGSADPDTIYFIKV